MKHIDPNSYTYTLEQEVRKKKPQLETIKLLLQLGANPNKDRVLVTASRNGKWDIVNAILDHTRYKKEPNILGMGLWDAVHENTHKSIEMAKKLIYAGADTSVRFRYTIGIGNIKFLLAPLYFAVINKNLALLKLLLKHGADLKLIRGDDDVNKVAYRAAKNTGNYEFYNNVLKFLIEEEAYSDAIFYGIVLYEISKNKNETLVGSPCYSNIFSFLVSKNNRIKAVTFLNNVNNAMFRLEKVKETRKKKEITCPDGMDSPCGVRFLKQS